MPIAEVVPFWTRAGTGFKGPSDNFRIVRESSSYDESWTYTVRGVSDYQRLFEPLLLKMGLELKGDSALRSFIPHKGSYLDLMSHTSAARQIGARVSLCVAPTDPRINEILGDTKSVRRDSRQGIAQLVGRAEHESTWQEITTWMQQKTPLGFDLITEVGDRALDSGKRPFPQTSQDFLTLVDRAYSVLSPTGTMIMQVSVFAENSISSLVERINQLSNGTLYADYVPVRKVDLFSSYKAAFVIQKRANAPKDLAMFKI